MCSSSNWLWRILLFPWKNTNTLTPFPNCEHLNKKTHTQLSNPKKGELKNIYKCFLVDLSQLIAGKVLTFLTSHRQVVTWTKGEKGRLKNLDKWRFSKWDDKNESFTSPWLQNFERSENGSEGGDELIPLFMRYRTDFISVFGTCFHPPEQNRPLRLILHISCWYLKFCTWDLEKLL